MFGSGGRGRKHPGHLRPASLLTTTATQGEIPSNIASPFPHAIHTTCVTFTCELEVASSEWTMEIFGESLKCFNGAEKAIYKLDLKV